MSKRLEDSIKYAWLIVGGIATIITVIGVSLKDIMALFGIQGLMGIFLRIAVIIIMYLVVASIIWLNIGRKYKNEIKLKIGNNLVQIKEGDIFKEDAWRIIAMDTHFSTVVDDIVISKGSLHGQLVLQHGSIEGIEKAVKAEATRRGIKEDGAGYYTFPPGTAIPYEGKDGHYIMIALNKLNQDHESKTQIMQYESTLMHMWKDVRRVYAGNAIALPLLGDGITDFEDGEDDPKNLLRCILCTLNTSKVHFNKQITVVIFDGKKEQNKLPLYEYKDIFKMAKNRVSGGD